MTKMVIKIVSKKNNNNDESEKLNQDSEIIEKSSNHKFEDLEDDNFHFGNSESGEHWVPIKKCPRSFLSWDASRKN